MRRPSASDTNHARLARRQERLRDAYIITSIISTKKSPFRMVAEAVLVLGGKEAVTEAKEKKKGGEYRALLRELPRRCCWPDWYVIL